MAVKPFKGKDSKAEEMAEARSVRAGRVSPAQYAKKEQKEGDKKPISKLQSTGKAIASGRMSPSQYAAGMNMGGVVKGKKC